MGSVEPRTGNLRAKCRRFAPGRPRDRHAGYREAFANLALCPEGADAGGSDHFPIAFTVDLDLLS